MYIADTYNNRIRKVTNDTGIISTFAGSGNTSVGCLNTTDTSSNVDAASVQLNNPYGIALNSDKTELYVSDSCNFIIRKIVLSTNIITTIAGSGRSGISSTSVTVATNFRINYPTGVALDVYNIVYIAERRNRILRVNVTSNTVTVVAGNFKGGTSTEIGDNGPATSSYLKQPFSVAVANVGTSVELYIADSGQNRVRKVGVDGNIYTIAGNGSDSTSDTAYNGAGSTSVLFTSPKGVIVDSATNDVYFATNNDIEQLKTAPTYTPTSYPTDPTFTPTAISPSTIPTCIPSTVPTTATPSITPSTSTPSTIPPTASPTSQPTTSPTSQPTKLNKLEANLIGIPWDSDVVEAKAKYYLGAYIAFFFSIFLILIALDKSNIWDKTRSALYDSSFSSGIHLPSFSTNRSKFIPEQEIPVPKRDSDQVKVKRLSKLILYDEHILNEEVRSQKEEVEYTTKNGDIPSDSFSLKNGAPPANGSSFHRADASFMSSFTSLKKVVSYSKSYHKYLQQQRTLLNCAPIIYPEGLNISIPMLCTIQLPPGTYEDFVIHLCNNHTFIGSFWACKGSFYSRNGRRYVFIVQNCLSFFLTSFSNCSLNLYGLGQLFTNMADVFIISPVSLAAGEFVRYLYILQYLDHQPGSLAHKMASRPIFPRMMVFLFFVGGMGLLFLSSMLTFNANKTGIIVQYIEQILLVTFVYEIIMMVMKFVSHYHLNVSVVKISIINIGVRYLEIILRHGLRENIDYFVVIKSLGFIRIEYVVDIDYAVTKGWIPQPTSKKTEITNPVHNLPRKQPKENEMELVVENREDEADMDLYGTYNTADDSVVYNENDRYSAAGSVTNPLFHNTNGNNGHDTTDTGAAEDMFYDVAHKDDAQDVAISEEELALQFENYLAQLLSAGRRGNGDVEDEPLSFEEWKSRKFKQGTRRSFVEKYAFFEKLNVAKSRQSVRPTSKPAYMESFRKTNALQIKSRPTKKLS